MILRCREYGISLNPKKCHFGVQKENLLGHIVSKEGVIIDPERVEAISKVHIPRTKKGINLFLGRLTLLGDLSPTLLN